MSKYRPITLGNRSWRPAIISSGPQVAAWTMRLCRTDTRCWCALGIPGTRPDRRTDCSQY